MRMGGRANRRLARRGEADAVGQGKVGEGARQKVAPCSVWWSSPCDQYWNALGCTAQAEGDQKGSNRRKKDEAEAGK